MQTIERFVDDNGLRINIEPTLGEMRSEENFQPKHLFEKEIIDLPLRFLQYANIEYVPICGVLRPEEPETFEHVVERVMEFMHRLGATHGGDDRILIATHSSVVNAFKRIYENEDNNNEEPHQYGEILEIEI
jgi:broad specificity phosphatase PhoE